MKDKLDETHTTVTSKALDQLPLKAEQLGTRAVHGRRERSHLQDSLAMPIYQTATFWFKNSEELRRYQEHEIQREEYGRYGNPTWKAVERHIEALEGAEQAVLFSSGMAAITLTFLSLLEPGQHLILTSDCYRRTREVVRTILDRMGIRISFLDPDRLDDLESLLDVCGGMVFSEIPSNPFLRVMDLRRAVPLAQSRGYRFVVDSTFATPVNLRPLEWGADLVVHSGTKYLGGHNDLLAGVAAGHHDLVEKIRRATGILGSVPSPHDAYLLLRGLKTLEVRVRRQNETALELARTLEQHPAIERVYYPGLRSHPDSSAAAALMSGFGGVVTFDVAGSFEDTVRFVDGCQIPFLAPSLGGVESLIEMPILMSYWDKSPAERARFGIRETLVRFSCGIENSQDVVGDVCRSLERCQASPSRPLQKADSASGD